MQIITNLNELGIREVFLPFVLIFTILFTILDKTRIFVRIASNESEEDRNRKIAENKKFATIISLAISLTAIFMHIRGTTIGGFDIVNFINSAVPGITGLIVAIFALFVVLALVMPSLFPETARLNMPVGFIIIVVALVIYLYAASLGWMGPSANLGFVNTWLENETLVSLGIVFLVGGAVIFWIISSKKPPKTKSHLGEMWKHIFRRPEY
jgi:hypothetical protein